MAHTEHYHTKFEEECFYHVYNRSVDKKPMFKSDRNYKFFIKKFDAYLSPVLDTYAFCLLGNHFHLLVKVRHSKDLSTFEKLTNQEPNKKSIHDLVSHQFRKFFQSYAMAFNKEQSRTGTLFQTPFKRALVDKDEYFNKLIYYIHANPQIHGLTNNFKFWQWSSYNRIIIDKESHLQKEAVLDWFGGKQNYIDFHTQNQTHLFNERLFLND